MENWKDIPGYDGYQVSDLGNVYSVSRGRMLTIQTAKKTPRQLAYKFVGIYKDGKQRHKLVHRLVMLAFVGPIPSSEHVVMHKNDDPGDNRLCNLRYGTHTENVNECVAKGRKPFSIEQMRVNAKKGGALTSRPVIATSLIDNSEKRFDSVRQAGRALKVCSSRICEKIRTGLTAKNHKYKYVVSGL